MNGCIIKGTPIVVDVWQHSICNEKKVFFLTHMHADHIKGLTSSWSYKFYTSPTNCALLKEKFQFKNGIVVSLELDEPHIITLDNERKYTMTITLIEANHVPGAVIFLFQGSFGNILYCGDMRYYPEIFKHPILHQTLHSGGIDQLYLDNTFFQPNYNFPSRKVASQQVFRLIEQHPNHLIIFGVRSLGKEDLLEEIALKFNELIYVDEVKYKQLKILKRPNVYTTDPSLSRIHAVPLNWIHRLNHDNWNNKKPTISIRLTAIEFGVPPDERSMVNMQGFFTIPYSDHSSWNELVSFVGGVKPRKIIPIVKHNYKKKDRISVALEGRDDMSVFDNQLSSPLKICLPETNSIDGLPNSVILANNYVAEKQKMSTKLRKRKVHKGVIYSPFQNENVTTCNTGVTDHKAIKPTGKTKSEIIDVNANDFILEVIPVEKSSVMLEWGLLKPEDEKLVNFSHISHQEHKLISNHKSRNKTNSEKTQNLSANMEFNISDLPVSNTDGATKLLTSALKDSDNLLMLMKNEPNMEIESLVSNVEMLTESLGKVNSYLTHLV